MEHKLGLPIHTVKFHSGSGTILSSDEKLVKIWRYKSSDGTARVDDSSASNKSVGSVVANVEGTDKLCSFIVAGDESDPFGYRSGMILCATDQPKMESYYIPVVGLAPKWCSFLENITEELEEKDLTREGTKDGKESIYENYKFVSRDEVEKLGISNLVGTPLLRGYMHGFFMDINLYNRVRAVANPFEYEEYRKKKLKERLDKKRASRIAPKENVSKHAVNPELATRLMGKSGGRTKVGKEAGEILTDSRFGNLFTNPDFQIDEEDENFKLRNPSGVAASKRRRNDLDSDEEDGESDVEQKGTTGFKAIEEDVDDSDEDSDSDEDGFHRGKVCVLDV
jgi:ribosome biogenesis protein ENP2